MKKPSRKFRKMRWLPATLPILVIAGCMTAGPDYKRPDSTLPAEFRDQSAQSGAASLADAPWWTVFDDKVLQGLVTEALANNLDVQVAVARIEQARALIGVAQSEGKPQVGYGGTVKGGRESITGEHRPQDYAGYRGGLLATWELDVWGRIRRSTEAARANLFAQEDIRRGVMLTLVSDLATGYFNLLGLDQELAIAQESASVYKKNVELFTLRFQAGRDNRLPVDRAQAAYHSSTDRIADLTRAIAQQENVLSVLVGAYPRGIKRGRPLTDQVTPKTPVGLTTDLLKRRPDILAAEQRMIQANAEVGVATANFYPRIGLSALAGIFGLRLSGSTINSFIWNVAGSVSGPIYSGGRLEEALRAQQAYSGETVINYKKTVLAAFRETSDALIAQRTLVDRRAALQSQVQSLKNAVDLSLLRYTAGRASYFEVLEAEQQLFPAQYSLAQTRRDQLAAVANLYKALGGGWDLPDSQQAKVSPEQQSKGVSTSSSPGSK